MSRLRRLVMYCLALLGVGKKRRSRDITVAATIGGVRVLKNGVAVTLW